MVSVSCWIARADLPCARGDDAFYKQPGVELALHGRYCLPSAIGYLPHVDEVFSGYPPLYQLAFAAWIRLFGFSLGSAVAFNHALHLLGVTAVGLATASLLRDRAISTGVRTTAVAATVAVHFGDMRFFDRQEELALLFLWIEISLFNLGLLSGVRGAVVSGLLVGLAGLVGPWPGMLAGMVVVTREVLRSSVSERRDREWRRRGVRLLLIGLIAAAPTVCWLSSMELRYPGVAVAQFREHLGRVQNVSALREPGRLLSSFLYAPQLTPAVGLVLLFLPTLLRPPRFGGPLAPATVPALILTAAAGATFTALWRADSYVYLWTSLNMLLPCFGYTVASMLSGAANSLERAFAVSLALLCTAPFVRDPLFLCTLARELPADERPGHVFEELRRRIPERSVVAVSPRYWHCFEGRNPWRQIAILPWVTEKQRQEWEWIVLPAGHGTVDFRGRLLEDYELIAVEPATYRPFAATFQADEITWAYELYRRKNPSVETESSEAP